MDVKEDLSPVEGTPSKEVNSRGAGQNVYVSLDCGECPGLLFRTILPPLPSKLNKTQYLLTGAKFEFSVKAKKLPLTQTSTSNRLPSS